MQCNISVTQALDKDAQAITVDVYIELYICDCFLD